MAQQYHKKHNNKQCKFGCHRSCPSGRTPKGNRFDTCCRSCAMSKGSANKHDHGCNNRNKPQKQHQVSQYKHNKYQNNNNNQNKYNDNNDYNKAEQITDDDLALLGTMVSLKVVEDAGFCIATQKNRIAIIKKLATIQCSGQTALRDAVMIGITHMLKVKNILVKLGSIKHKFVHIVLTDGDDTCSTESSQSLGRVFLKLGNELGDYCKTYFIGVGLDYAAKRNLDIMSRLGGDSCELFNCQDTKIQDVFNRIKFNLGIKRSVIAVQHENKIYAAKKDQLVVEATAQKFLVLFTLDKSGSMAGGRWKRVVQAVAGFCVGLNSSDILGVVLFNDKPAIIT